MLPEHITAVLGPYGTPAGRAQFCPRTLAQVIPLEELRKHASGVTLDELFSDWPTTLHETTHWHQFLGTSIGGFLLAIRFAQEISTITKLRMLPIDTRKAILTHCFDDRQPLIIDQGVGDSVVTPSEFGPELRNACHNWQCLSRLYQVFEGYPSDRLLTQATISHIPGAIAYVIQETASLYGTDLQRFDYLGSADHWNLFHSSHLSRANHNGKYLSTRQLIECQATLRDMVIRISVDNAKENDIRGELEKLMNTSYLRPLSYAATVLSSFSKDSLHLATSVILAIDAALNPALPPFAYTKTRQSWTRVYPPVRFMDAINVLAKRETLPVFEELGGSLRARDSLSVSHELSEECWGYSPDNFLNPTGNSTDDRRFGDAVESGSFDGGTIDGGKVDFRYHRLLLWSQGELLRLRQQYRFALPIWPNLAGDLVPIIGSAAASDGALRRQNAAFRCPFVYTRSNDGELRFHHNDWWPRPLVDWGMSMSLVYGVITQMMVGKGPMQPYIVLGEKGWDSVFPILQNYVAALLLLEARDT